MKGGTTVKRGDEGGGPLKQIGPLQNSVGVFQWERSDLRKARLARGGTVVWRSRWFSMRMFLSYCQYRSKSYLFIIAIDERKVTPDDC